MGCGGSNHISKKYLPDVLDLQRALEEEQRRALEQQNLLRFKVEVMVNMLAMEEKKNEITSKRVETLKYLLIQQGISEQAFTVAISSSVLHEASGDQRSSQDLLATINSRKSKVDDWSSIGMIDIAGTIDRVAEEFVANKRDIFCAFADDADGKVVPSIPNDEFIKKLYTVTEKLSKRDIQVLYVISISLLIFVCKPICLLF